MTKKEHALCVHTIIILILTDSVSRYGLASRIKLLKRAVCLHGPR
jgi:hypothetical protein